MTEPTPDFDEYVRTLVDQIARDVDPSVTFAEIERRAQRIRALHWVQRGLLGFVVVAGACFVLFGLLRAAGHQGPAAAGPTTLHVATTTIDADLRVEVLAERSPADRSSTTVWLSVFTRGEGDHWRAVGRERVGPAASWTWSSVSTPGGVCSLVVSDAPVPNVAVSLRASGQAGCSEPFAFVLRRGTIAPQ